jgi:Mg2+ and Co2+ transporter CorA
MFRLIKSPIGFLLTAAAVILAISPEARKATRKLAVKGTAVVLDIIDQVKDATAGMSQQLSHGVEETNANLLDAKNVLPLSEMNTEGLTENLSARPTPQTTESFSLQ